MTKVALVHATPLSQAPIVDAFSCYWPEAEYVNVLDDSLSHDRNNNRQSKVDIERRILALSAYAVVHINADAVLFTCSAFTDAIDKANRTFSVPILTPNRAMIISALALGRRIGVLTSFMPTQESISQELKSTATSKAIEIEIHFQHADDAMMMLAQGDGDRHDALLANAAQHLPQVDVVLLAQYSTARAKPCVEQEVNCPVLTSPGSAVRALRAMFEP